MNIIQTNFTPQRIELAETGANSKVKAKANSVDAAEYPIMAATTAKQL
jgi:hypothetical protein